VLAFEAKCVSICRWFYWECNHRCWGLPIKFYLKKDTAYFNILRKMCGMLSQVLSADPAT
jgi:hypothetical protein